MTLRPAVVAVAVLLTALPLPPLVLRWADEGSRPVTERPASFQMYSAVARPSYSGVDRSGRERRLDPSALPVLLRAVDTGRVVPDRLCAAQPELVLVRRAGGADPGDFRC